MDFVVKNTKTIIELTSEHNDYKINATVTINTQDKIQDFNGFIHKGEVSIANFHCYRNNDSLTRNIHNVTENTSDVYLIVTDFINSVIEKYE